jgi:S-formylglutathione hydrolase FrmB
MAFAELRIFSEALGMSTTVNVIIPQRSTLGEIGTENRTIGGKYRCLYLLHGLSDDESIWMRRTSIERYASKYGIAVVMPRGDRSFYTDITGGEKYFTYISSELPKIITDLFPVSDRREDNIIGGLSMGGYGAIKAALRKPERFSRAIALSPVADIRSFFDRAPATLGRVFGDKGDISAHDDLFELSASLNDSENRPMVFMAVGNSDFLYSDIERFKEHLEKLGYDLSYLEGEGAHSWDFWDEYIKYALEWAYGRKD